MTVDYTDKLLVLGAHLSGGNFVNMFFNFSPESTSLQMPPEHLEAFAAGKKE